MRLIDANELRADIFEIYETEYPTATGAFERFTTKIVPELIDQQPTIDAAPIVRAHWEDCDLTDGKDMVAGGYKRCSNCHGFGFISENWYGDLTDQCLTNYCPDCGARMCD